MSQPRRTLEQIFQAHVQTLALTLQPFTVVKYDYVARHFVSYLRSTFPDVRRLSQLRRDPHMLVGFAGSANCARRLATTPASSVSYACAVCSTI